MSEYFDIRCGDDLDPFGRDASPLEVLAQDLYHWLITAKFALLRDPDWGKDLESFLGQELPTALAFDIENDVRREFADRIDDARCTITDIGGEPESKKLELIAEVDGTFLPVALKLSPNGIVRVFG